MNISSNKSRREFIKSSGMATIGFMGLYQFINPTLSQASVKPSLGYGPLQKDAKGILNLPKGFSYKIISQMGEQMNDGLFLPGAPDGMGTFRGKNNRTIIIRNHEISPDSLNLGGFGSNNELVSNIRSKDFYDFGNGKMPSLGGTTTFIYNEDSGAIENQFLSLAGTVRNCAGGVTPWNSWLTCEESTITKGSYEGSAEQDHGYVFEVPATEKARLSDPVPIKGMGRFNHEAVAVDPATGIVYLTEDRGDGIFYRFIPNRPGKLQ
ncbi:MAG: alkaline phosphatase PhoX, partial [Cyclobacteriaceae bacterium]